MKITKKRVAIATAAAALATVGIFGGTYAKYQQETLPTTDSARLAKFYLESTNALDLFQPEYDNEAGTTGSDVKNAGTVDSKNLIAPNVTTSAVLEFDAATEVKSKLTFSELGIDTNLPSQLLDHIYITIHGDEYALSTLVGAPTLASYDVEDDIQAGTTLTTYPVPVAFRWDLDNHDSGGNSMDESETDAAIAQYTDANDYYLNLTGHATLTQID